MYVTQVKNSCLCFPAIVRQPGSYCTEPIKHINLANLQSGFWFDPKDAGLHQL